MDRGSTPTFAILGIGISTFGERWGFCFKIFNWEGWYSCSWHDSYWIEYLNMRGIQDMKSFTTIPTHRTPDIVCRNVPGPPWYAFWADFDLNRADFGISPSVPEYGMSQSRPSSEGQKFGFHILAGRNIVQRSHVETPPWYRTDRLAPEGVRTWVQ